MDKIITFFEDMFSMLPTIKIMDVVDILLVAVVIYAVFTMIRTTGSARIAKSVIIILLLLIVSVRVK